MDYEFVRSKIPLYLESEIGYFSAYYYKCHKTKVGNKLHFFNKINKNMNNSIFKDTEFSDDMVSNLFITFLFRLGGWLSFSTWYINYLNIDVYLKFTKKDVIEWLTKLECEETDFIPTKDFFIETMISKTIVEMGRLSEKPTTLINIQNDMYKMMVQ
jgi:hypothetical protein